ncbi:F0F1 ATP synthase subunit gamma [Azotobacter vinelandii]|uniref:F0F1 ATP synthase subunit gamma n=1 Tax=Azotobacter vinelandii TaxID=354 RepID=UPI0007736A33|nr:FoF1 ATP synthase subunit gamma [Azotobacter vinelandii]
MSGRLGEVAGHLATTRELGLVIGAMRAIAAARSREARNCLDSVRAYAETLGTAIGEALALLPEAQYPEVPAGGDRRHLVLALCAEQGFVGGFNERVLESAGACLGAAGAQLWVLGERGATVAAERGLRPAWSAPMIAHPDEMSALAGRMADALYARLGDGTPTRVSLVHAQPGEEGRQPVLTRTLLPFDYRRFPASHRHPSPAVTLAPARLVAGLAEEYVYAELCEALMLSFAAENEARMQAMVAARGNVERRSADLLAEYRRVRQDEITDEIIELSAARL